MKNSPYFGVLIAELSSTWNCRVLLILCGALTLASNARLHAGDIDGFVVGKAKSYLQNSSAAPTLAPLGDAGPYLFYSEADGFYREAGGTILGATLRLPGGTIRTLEDEGDDGLPGGDEFQLMAGFATENALNTAYPTGIYTMNISTRSEGSKSFNMNLPAATYPNVPRISNYTAAQAIHPSAPFRLMWDSLAGTAQRLGIQVSTENGDEVYGTGVFDSDFTPGTATYLDIPAHTLGPGRTYRLEFIAAKVTGTVTSYPGATGFTAYATVVQSTLKTTGSPDVTAPTLISSKLSNNVVTLTFSEPMSRVGHSISWIRYVTGLNFSNFRWVDPRNFSFNVTGTGGFRAVLNPSGYDLYFKDVSNNSLAQNTQTPILTAVSATLTPRPYALLNTPLQANSAPSGLNYQWQRNGTNIYDSTSATLIPRVAGNYRVIAKAGNSSFTTPPVTVFNTNQTQQIYWQNTNGALAVWYLYRTNFLFSSALPSIQAGWKMVAQRDFNSDGHVDFLFQNNLRSLQVWSMNGTARVRSNIITGYSLPVGSQVVNASPFDPDTHHDLLVHNIANGSLGTMIMTWGTNFFGALPLNTAAPGLNPVVMADFNADGKSDIVWVNTNRLASVWFMNGTARLGTAMMFGSQPIPAGWTVRGAADLNADGQKDILLQNNSNQTAVWLMNRTNRTVIRTVALRNAAGLGWTIVGPK